MSSFPLNALRTFEAVATRLSFAKGAEALHVTPAAVSSQIRVLEERLGQPLFHRQGRQVTLTSAGRKLLPGVQSGLAELRHAVRLVSQDRQEGVLNVTMMPSILQKWLMPRLHRFYTANPQVDLRVAVDNDLVDFDEIDMHAAVRFGGGRWSGVRAARLMDDWILPVCSRRLLDEVGPIDTTEQLRQFDLLYTPSPVWDPWFKAFGGSLPERRRAILNDSISILMAAEQGEGIALSRWSLVARDIGAGRLVPAADAIIRSGWSHYFVAPAHYFDLPKVATFRDWLAEQCAGFEEPGALF